MQPENQQNCSYDSPSTKRVWSVVSKWKARYLTHSCALTRMALNKVQWPTISLSFGLNKHRTMKIPLSSKSKIGRSMIEWKDFLVFSRISRHYCNVASADPYFYPSSIPRHSSLEGCANGATRDKSENPPPFTPSSTSRHPEYIRMYQTLWQDYYWLHEVKDVEDLVIMQQIRGHTRHTPHFMLFLASWPLKPVGVNMLDLLQKNFAGNQFIIIMSYRYSKLTGSIHFSKTTDSHHALTYVYLQLDYFLRSQLPLYGKWTTVCKENFQRSLWPLNCQTIHKNTVLTAKSRSNRAVQQKNSCKMASICEWTAIKLGFFRPSATLCLQSKSIPTYWNDGFQPIG